MKVLKLLVLALIFSLELHAQHLHPDKVKMVTFKGVLSGAYHDYLADNKEYQERSARYEQISNDYKLSRQLINDLEKAIQGPNFTPYFRERAAHIADLVKNNETGDVYKQIRIYGIDFALILNDILPIIQLYECERTIITARKELEEIESWAKSMAAVSEYFKHLFLEGKLNQPLSYYTRVQSYDKQIDWAYRKFLKNGSRLEEKAYPGYEEIYSNWQLHKEELQFGKGRESFFDILEKKYGNSIKDSQMGK